MGIALNRHLSEGVYSNSLPRISVFFIAMETEIWKDIEWYEWKYQVSNLWKVKSFNYKNSKILKPVDNWHWYMIISLCMNNIKKTFRIHKLVAKYFINNSYKYNVVNHKNWMKNDNRVENLEWCTTSQNNQHAWDTWLNRNHHFLIKNPNKWKFWKYHYKSKKVIQYYLSWKLIRNWWSIVEVERELWILWSNITRACRLNRTAGGFIWRYQEAEQEFENII